MERSRATVVAAAEGRRREVARGVVAGLRLAAERPLSGCVAGSPVTGRLSIRAAGGDPPAGDFVEAPGEPGSAWLRLDGRRLLLAGEEDWGARVRRLVPYASWLQALPVLHASAVERDGAALALIGASGVGKSTLAGHLAGLGYRRLADDLTPCRARDGGFVLPRSAQAAAPLTGLVFLERQPRRRPALESLSRAVAVRRLAANGWGDLALPELWRAQFDFYVGLAASCPAQRLVMPDDATRLAQSAATAAALLASL